MSPQSKGLVTTDRRLVISDRHGHISRRNADPYQDDAGLKEPCLCEACRSVYRQKRWLDDPVAAADLAHHPDTNWVLCPACRKVEQRHPEGLLTLTGDYVWQHEEEIRNMFDNEIERQHDRNPQERIMRMERQDDALVIETTDHKLAERLGRAVQRAHNGKLHIDWGADTCRVEWMRAD